MPIYEYFCDACDTRFEKLRPMSAAGQPQSCPTCNSISASAISRTARIGAAGDGDDGADLPPPPAAARHGHSHGGHGHSHGPGGHMH